jgi:hypothetical protein
MQPSRSELERRVDELAAQHSGEAFATAARAYADSLDPAAREELGAVLLERAGGPEEALRRQWEERSWLQRALRRLEGQRPPR